MRAKLEQRLRELRAEYEKGEQRLAELDAERLNLERSMLRISGAIQVLEEEIGASDGDTLEDDGQ